MKKSKRRVVTVRTVRWELVHSHQFTKSISQIHVKNTNAPTGKGQHGEQTSHRGVEVHTPWKKMGQNSWKWGPLEGQPFWWLVALWGRGLQDLAWFGAALFCFVFFWSGVDETLEVEYTTGRAPSITALQGSEWLRDRGSVPSKVIWSWHSAATFPA
jgi:hypothetical protein